MQSDQGYTPDEGTKAPVWGAGVGHAANEPDLFFFERIFYAECRTAHAPDAKVDEQDERRGTGYGGDRKRVGKWAEKPVVVGVCCKESSGGSFHTSTRLCEQFFTVSRLSVWTTANWKQRRR